MNQSDSLKEFDEIFDSLAPELKEALQPVDYKLRLIWKEAMTCGVPKRVIEQRMPQKFWELAADFKE